MTGKTQKHRDPDAGRGPLHSTKTKEIRTHWIPAFAGMTSSSFPLSSRAYACEVSAQRQRRRMPRSFHSLAMTKRNKSWSAGTGEFGLHHEIRRCPAKYRKVLACHTKPWRSMALPTGIEPVLPE